MSEAKIMRPCPDLFKETGAASVLIRHALFELAPLYDALDRALEKSTAEFKALGIARMEIAEAELNFRKAKDAALHIMVGHDLLRAMLARHGIETPTDDDICKVHKKQLEDSKREKLPGVSADTSRMLIARGNSR
jgi:hypothetical protein